MTAVRLLAAVLVFLILFVWLAHDLGQKAELVGVSVDPREDVQSIRPPSTTTTSTTTATVFKQPQHVRVIAESARSAPSERCGGDLPPCSVMMRESGGNIHAFNPTGCGGRGCRGKWQCDPRTCSGTGTEAEQDAEARALWDHGRGCQHWAAC